MLSDNQIQIKNLKAELKLLYFIAQSIHSLDIDVLLKEIVDIASKITHADSCFVYILDKSEEELVLRASKNPHGKLLTRVKMKVGEGITGWVAMHKKVVSINQNAYQDKRFKLFSSLPEDRYEAFLSVPILNKRGVCGVINIQHKNVRKHTATEIKLLSAIGKLIGGAIENAVLIEETLQLKEALEIRKIVEKAKGILMIKNNLSENDAFKLLQKESMNTRKSIREIAEAIILADKLNLGS
jgi:uroporphyrinogen-III synthase